MLFTKPDRPLDALTLAIMREVNALAQKLELQYFLCGAMARDILLQHVHGLTTGAATVDVDFGVAVDDWAHFEKIKANLIETRRFVQNQKMSHRLLYKPDANNSGYPIDIIPFGGVATVNNQIAWPPDQAEVMKVIAYQEALANSVNIQVDHDLVVPVASLPGLALLKLFAWADRGKVNAKDAHDLVILMRTYHQAGNQDRLYNDEAELLDQVGFDLHAAGPRLLGKDVRRIASRKTFKLALALLNDETKCNRLTTHMAAKLQGADDSVAAAQHLLEQFKAGLTGK